MYTQALDSKIPAMPKENYDWPTELPTTEHERDEWNMDFTITELNTAIQHIRSEAVGTDDIHIRDYEHLPNKYKRHLLSAFNEMLHTGKFPPTWKYYIPIFIRKANTTGQNGKDHSKHGKKKK
jgi:potassium voltage-gated channel Eag-related subfamily H protein 8